jgi:hypothetical protein
VTRRRRSAPGARRVRSIPIGLIIAVLLSTIACDRWKAGFRVTNRDAVQRAAARTPLPDSGYRLRWDTHTVPAVMPRGSATDVRIAFTNVGDVVWPDILAGDPAGRGGGYAVRLAYDWSAAPAPSDMPARRVDLPRPVRPGETMTLLVPLEAPDRPGEYCLTFGLVQELVTWFAAKGAPNLVVPVTVK